MADSAWETEREHLDEVQQAVDRLRSETMALLGRPIDSTEIRYNADAEVIAVIRHMRDRIDALEHEVASLKLGSPQ